MKKATKRVGGLIAVVCIVFLIVRAQSEGDQSEPRNYTVISQNFLQPINHGEEHGPRFNQEILILTPDGAALESPVFFILGNEGDATIKKLVKLYEAYGAPKDVIFIQAEHRGYGQSISNQSDQSNPSYISIEQALADYHRFITTYKEKYKGPWMAAGYSYGGGLVIDFAYFYPDDIEVVLASSAVIDWPIVMPEYDQMVIKNLGESFYNRMAGHVNKLRPNELFDETWLEREFITNMVLGLSQYSQYQYLSPVIKALSFLPTDMFVGILKWADAKVTGKSGWTAAVAFGKKSLSHEEALTGKYNWYTWKYQQCTKTGTFWVSSRSGGVFPKSKKDNLLECSSMYKQQPLVSDKTPWSPRSRIRSLKVPVVYTAGGKDPWMALGQEKTDWIKDQDYFFLKEGYHCPERHDLEAGEKVLDRMLSYVNQGM